jgi:hypothetical protein
MIIDDLGYIQQTREEMEVVFTLLAERYERGSVLLTSNLPFFQWEGIFIVRNFKFRVYSPQSVIDCWPFRRKEIVTWRGFRRLARRD